MNKQVLKADKRTVSGRKVKNLRKQGIIPANVYGKNVKSEAIQVDLKEFEKVYKEAGETGLIGLSLDKEERPVLVHNIQLNPVTEGLYHVDFLQVDLKEKVEAEVPVELVGESPAEKQSIGTVVQYINEIKVEALPMDLPEKFEIDISSLSEVDQSIFVKDLKIDASKVEVKSSPDEIVVKVEPPQKEEVIAPPPAAEGEVAATTEGTEGGEPSEGAASDSNTEEK